MSLALRLSLFLCASVVALAAPARAQERSTSEELSTAALPKAGALSGAPALFPVEVVLDQLRSALGMSFVFDSRLLAGAQIRPVDASRSSEARLRDELRSIDLDLHKVAANTFAITHVAAAASHIPEPAPVLISQPAQLQLGDILVRPGQAPVVVTSANRELLVAGNAGQVLSPSR